MKRLLVVVALIVLLPEFWSTVWVNAAADKTSKPVPR